MKGDQPVSTAATWTFLLYEILSRRRRTSSWELIAMQTTRECKKEHLIPKSDSDSCSFSAINNHWSRWINFIHFSNPSIYIIFNFNDQSQYKSLLQTLPCMTTRVLFLQKKISFIKKSILLCLLSDNQRRNERSRTSSRQLSSRVSRDKSLPKTNPDRISICIFSPRTRSSQLNECYMYIYMHISVSLNPICWIRIGN